MYLGRCQIRDLDTSRNSSLYPRYVIPYEPIIFEFHIHSDPFIT